MIAGNTFPPELGNVGSLTVSSDTPAMCLWLATGRELRETRDPGTTIPSKNNREASICYMKGLAETITIRTDTSNAWRWRRIVFQTKATLPISTTSLAYYRVAQGDSFMYQRANTAIPFSDAAQMYEYLFRGLGLNAVSAIPQDWLDPITAPVDTVRVKLMYDKVTRISSGNDAGVVRTYRRWHPMNENLHYNDQEFGGVLSSSPLSTETRLGMGNVYVMDLFVGNSEDSGDNLDFLPTSTLYWHEK